MKYVNGFKILEFLVGGLMQWAITITGLVFFVKTIVDFSTFNFMMIPLCVLGVILCTILQPLFYFCALGRQMEINELYYKENE
jgi:hypothetical protein